MIRCGIVEENEAMLARFMGGLNREIQTILEYKEYTNMTRLFHLACKAEREVQDRQALARTNFSVGRSSSWTPRTSSTPTRPTTASLTSATNSNRDTRKQAPPPQVRDYDHVPKLKLNTPPFEGRYIPNVYLTWELETEQRCTCLQYPEDRRVAATVCEFISFASVWSSKHCRLYPIPVTWAALKMLCVLVGFHYIINVNYSKNCSI